MRSKRARGSLGGYTLIELVVVIAILAVLAAFAIPRLARLEVEERRAATEALAASVRSHAALAHALWVANGASPVSMEGTSVAIADGYPTTISIRNVVADAPGFTFAGGVWANGAAATPAECAVTYTAPDAPGYSPEVVVVTTGC